MFHNFFDFQPSKLFMPEIPLIFNHLKPIVRFVATNIKCIIAVNAHGQPLRVMVNLGKFFGKNYDGTSKSLRKTLEVSD